MISQKSSSVLTDEDKTMGNITFLALWLDL